MFVLVCKRLGTNKIIGLDGAIPSFFGSIPSFFGFVRLFSGLSVTIQLDGMSFFRYVILGRINPKVDGIG